MQHSVALRGLVALRAGCYVVGMEKLSEEMRSTGLRDVAKSPDLYTERWAAKARALEERVAEMEAEISGVTHGGVLYAADAAAATARAEAAEAEVAQLKARVATLEDGGFMDTASQRAEVARLREENAVAMERALQSDELALSVIDERDALRAKLEKVRAKLTAG